MKTQNGSILSIMQDKRICPSERGSHSASQSFVQELQRVRNMTVEERALEALGMADRFSWVTPVGKQQQNGQS